MTTADSQQSNPDNAQIKTLTRYTDLANRQALYHVLRLARSFGVFDILERGPCTVETLATSCDVDLETIRALIYLLCHLEVVEQYGDDIALAAVMRLRSDMNPDFGQTQWERLVGLADGENIARGEGSAEQTRRSYRNRMFEREWTLTPSALELARVLGIGSQRCGLQILDWGCGTGIWGLTLAHRDVQANVTMVDWPEPMETVKGMAESIGIADRVTCVAGKFSEVNLPEDRFDLVLLANHLQLVAPTAWTVLLERIRGLLKVGGEIAVIDVFEGQEAGDVTRNVLALELSLAHPEFGICSPTVLQEQLAANRFGKPGYRHLEVPPYLFGVMLAAKELP
ncbi:MAG: methyltransferase domain-containing protein [Pirellulales bacterium]|nr:methyltransferase domain-containing protein [Pirellulales bacterium]